MLKHALFAAAFAALLGASARADEASDIIDKAIKAHGGEERLKKDQTAHWNVKGTMNAMGMKVPYTGKYKIQMPDRFRIDIAAEFGGQKVEFAAATNGKEAWESAFGMTRNMGDKKAKAFNAQLYGIHLGSLVPLKDKKFTLAKAGDEKVNGKPAVGIKVTAAERPDVILWFDKETGLLVKMVMQTWDEFSDKEVPQEVEFQDYKEKNGAKQFNKLVIRRDGKDFIEEELSDYTPVDAIDAKEFAKP